MYAVIMFRYNNDEYVSAAPKKWISENKTSCMWPKNAGIERKTINLKMKPKRPGKNLKTSQWLDIMVCYLPFNQLLSFLNIVFEEIFFLCAIFQPNLFRRYAVIE